LAFFFVVLFNHQTKVLQHTQIPYQT